MYLSLWVWERFGYGNTRGGTYKDKEKQNYDGLKTMKN